MSGELFKRAATVKQLGLYRSIYKCDVKLQANIQYARASSEVTT